MKDLNLNLRRMKMSKKQILERLKEILKDTNDMPYKEEWQKLVYVCNQIEVLIDEEVA